MTPEIRHSVCLFVQDDCGKVLAISRGHDLEAWGMPGGGVEANETLEEAVIREVYEETGYLLENPCPVYVDLVEWDPVFICTTFTGSLVLKTRDEPHSVPFEGIVDWVDPEILLKGPFSEYNQKLFKVLGL